LQTKKLTPEEVKSLYESHGAALAAYACCFGLDHASAEDIVHQLFLKILGVREFAPETPVAYLYGATRNASLNRRRDRQRETAFADPETWFTHPHRSYEEILNLQNALKQLPEEQRETIYLKVWAGMTFLEISALTGTPSNTVASRYRYALEKLREHLAQRSAERG
jgi:RNA polymerase sigma-70 factor (ECF subfamily)